MSALTASKQAPTESTALGQLGINMVDLMMWLVIAALLLAAALQSIGYYQKAAWTYQVKSDVQSALTWASAAGSIKGGNVTNEDLLKALNAGDLKMTKTGGTYNNALISNPGSGNTMCVGVRANMIQPPNNVFYVSAAEPSNVVQSNGLGANCGTYSETALNEAGDGSGFIMDGNLVYNANATSIEGWTKESGVGGVTTLEQMTTGGPTAEIPSYIRVVWTTGLAAGQPNGANVSNGSAGSGIVKSGTTYKQSVWVRSNKNISVYTDAIILNSSNGVVFDSPSGGSAMLQAGVWKSMTVEWTTPANSNRAVARIVTTEGQAIPTGTQLDVTGFVLSVK